MNAADFRRDTCRRVRHAQGMDTDYDLFLDAVEVMVLDALARIGDEPRPRFEFFRRLLAAAREVAGDHGCRPHREADH